MRDFRAFLLRGNVVDLAVALVVAVAFGAVITALVEDFITPLIAAIGGQPDFSALDFTINESTFRYGHFINQVLSFVIIAAAVFFLIVKPMNAQVPIAARRCAFCASELAPVTSGDGRGAVEAPSLPPR
jgi:large conductance mechanosensitive channel